MENTQEQETSADSQDITWFDVDSNWVSFIFSHQSCDSDAIGHAHCQVPEVKGRLVSADRLDVFCSRWYDMKHRQRSHPQFCFYS